MKRITGRLTEKNGKWYAVINLYDMSGKRKEKWQNLHLDVKRGNKTEAKYLGLSGRQSTGRKTKSRYAIRLSKTNSKAVASKDTTL